MIAFCDIILVKSSHELKGGVKQIQPTFFFCEANLICTKSSSSIICLIPALTTQWHQPFWIFTVILATAINVVTQLAVISEAYC